MPERLNAVERECGSSAHPYQSEQAQWTCQRVELNALSVPESIGVIEVVQVDADGRLKCPVRHDTWTQTHVNRVAGRSVPRGWPVLRHRVNGETATVARDRDCAPVPVGATIGEGAIETAP
jgi:hypothetical protein